MARYQPVWPEHVRVRRRIQRDNNRRGFIVSRRSVWVSTEAKKRGAGIIVHGAMNSEISMHVQLQSQIEV
jgi:hypothetical protein